MLERDMEDLIAHYPDEFFPEKGFKLTGRQKSFAGVGRFDLLFEDRFKTTILMELKAVPARYEVAHQLAKYKDELRHQGGGDILMWLVAPSVSHSVREFLDRIGIEYSEIHAAEFLRVAARHNAVISAPAPLPIESSETYYRAANRNPTKHQDVGINTKCRDFIKPTICQLWQVQRNWITRDQLAEQLSKQVWAVEKLNAEDLTGAKRQNRVGNWVDWFGADYKQGLHGLKDEFERVKVDRKWAYRPRHEAPVHA